MVVVPYRTVHDNEHTRVTHPAAMSTTAQSNNPPTIDRNSPTEEEENTTMTTSPSLTMPLLAMPTEHMTAATHFGTNVSPGGTNNNPLVAKATATAATTTASALSTTTTDAYTDTTNALLQMTTATTLVPKKQRGKRAASRPTLVVSLGPNDVLLGRGSLFADYQGNVQLRQVVTANRQAYVDCRKHKEKQVVVQSIIQAVHALGGRFLRRIESVTKDQKKAQKAKAGNAANHQHLQIHSNNVPSAYLWTLIDDPEIITDKIKQLFRDARVTRRMRHRKTPLEEDDTTDHGPESLTLPTHTTADMYALSEEARASITAAPGTFEEQLQIKRLLEAQARNRVTAAAPGTVEEQLQLHRMEQQSHHGSKLNHATVKDNPLEKQFQKIQKKQKNLQQYQQQQMEKKRKENSQAALDKRKKARATETTSLPADNDTMMPMLPHQHAAVNPLNAPQFASLSAAAGVGGMNLAGQPNAAVGYPGAGMNNPLTTAGGGDPHLMFPFRTMDGTDRPGHQPQPQPDFHNFRVEQERQELALRAEHMRQEQERQELVMRTEQMRQEQELQELNLRTTADQEQHAQRQQDLLQQQELANFLRANPPNNMGGPSMGLMPHDDSAAAQFALGGPFGPSNFSPNDASLNQQDRINHPAAAMGRNGLVDLARLAEIMQATGQMPNHPPFLNSQPM